MNGIVIYAMIFIFLIMILITYAFYVLISKIFPGALGEFLIYFIIPFLVLITTLFIAIIFKITTTEE